MKKIYNKNAREKQLLEEAYGAIYERRNPDAGEWGGGLKGVFPGAEEGPNFDEEEEKQYDATNMQLMKLIQRDIMTGGMTAQESIEGLGVDPAYQKDLFRRYQKWADSWSEGPIEPASWFENEEEHDEYNPGYGKVEEVDYLTKHILDRVKTLADDEQFPGSPQDALDITMEEIRDSLQSYSLENIGFTEDEEANVNWDEDKEVDEVGGGMNAKEFNIINKTTPE